MNRNIITILIASFCLFVSMIADNSYGQGPSGSWPTVGIESAARAILPRGDFVAIGVKDRCDLILRVISINESEKDGDYIYDLRYIGLLPGEYDLSKYLLLPDGTVAEGLPAIKASVLPLLPESHQGELVSSQLKAMAPPGGYKLFFTIVWIFWALLLLPLIFAFREKKQIIVEVTKRPATLAELLRPLIESAVSGRLDASGKSHLERLLMRYWQKELSLDEDTVYKMLVKIKQHPGGGELFKKLELWLHRPPKDGTVDIDILLAPYNSVPLADESLEVSE